MDTRVAEMMRRVPPRVDYRISGSSLLVDVVDNPQQPSFEQSLIEIERIAAILQQAGVSYAEVSTLDMKGAPARPTTLCIDLAVKFSLPNGKISPEEEL